MSIYLWIGLASAALVLVSVVASVRKYLTGLILTSYVTGAVLSSIPGIMLRKFRPGRKTRRTIELTIDGDTLHLDNATSEDQERLIGLWLSRHNFPTDG